MRCCQLFHSSMDFVRRESVSLVTSSLLAPSRGTSSCHLSETAWSFLYNTGSSPHPVRDGHKQQLLYCRVGIGFHLQILSNGSVGGVHKPTEYCEFNPHVQTLSPWPHVYSLAYSHLASVLDLVVWYAPENSQTFMHCSPCICPCPQAWLKVFAMKQGVVGIRGVKSGLYLCINGERLAYGAVSTLHSSHQQ